MHFSSECLTHGPGTMHVRGKVLVLEMVDWLGEPVGEEVLESRFVEATWSGKRVDDR